MFFLLRNRIHSEFIGKNNTKKHVEFLHKLCEKRQQSHDFIVHRHTHTHNRNIRTVRISIYIWYIIQWDKKVKLEMFIDCVFPDDVHTVYFG